MAKQIQKTDKVTRLLNEIMGEDTDLNQIAVFEATAVDSLPLTKRGSIFHKARVEESTLLQMAAYLQQGEHVPLLNLHHADGPVLPVGRLFDGKVTETDGITQLQVLFYISTSTQEGADLVAKLDTGIINDVSVGLVTEKALCSECGWDYFGPEASFMNIFEQTCANEHTIGDDGTHLRLIGMDTFIELSLVDNGASRTATIAKRATSVLADSRFKDDFERLAANGIDPRAVVLFTNPSKEIPMDPKAIKAAAEAKAAKLKADAEAEALAAAEAGNAENQNQGEDADTDGETIALSVHVTLMAEGINKDQQIETLTASITTKDAEIATLTAAADTDIKTVLSDNDKAKVYLSEICKKFLVAAGESEPEVPESMGDLLASIEQAQAKVSGMFVPGGVADTATTDTDDGKKKADLSAFKTRK